VYVAVFARVDGVLDVYVAAFARVGGVFACMLQPLRV
jgi:hypothetical protein